MVVVQDSMGDLLEAGMDSCFDLVFLAGADFTGKDGKQMKGTQHMSERKIFAVTMALLALGVAGAVLIGLAVVREVCK